MLNLNERRAIAEDYATLCACFQQDRRWVGYNYALGSQNAKQTFHVAIESTAMSSFLPPESANWKLREVVVDMHRLDTVFQEVTSATGLREPRTFLKMDTQGYDLEVFHGAVNCLAQIVGIQSEVSVIPVYVGMPHYLDAIRIYEKSGFELYGLAEVFRHPEHNNLMEMNCIMMRPKA